MQETAKKVFSSYKFYLATAFLLLTVYLNFLGSFIIYKYFPNRVTVDDLLFRLTPYISWTQYTSDIANIFSVLILTIYIFSGRAKRIVYVITTFGFMELMRAIIIILTPLGGPLGNGAHYGISGIHQYGQFPSGHTALVFLAYFLVQKTEAPKMKILLLISIIVEIVSLILSHGHYSIDIVGGILVAYVAYNVVIKYKAKLLIS